MTLRSLLSSQVALAVALALPAYGQGRAIDEGTFVLSRAGAQIGSESFQLVRMPGTPLMRITAQQTVGDHRIASMLTADSLGTPQTYNVTVKTGNATELTLKAAGAAGRLSSMSHDKGGNESMKEYVVAPGGTVVLDDELVSHYYFVALQRRGGGLKLIIPRLGRDVSATLTPGGLESIDVGGRSVTATKYSLSGGGAGPRELWVDAAGRLLRVSLPGGVTAAREELPR
jgi:hypothetical protein